MAEHIEDPRRPEPPKVAGEREMLEAWLEFHRSTLLIKCHGIDDEGRKARPVATSLLSLHGLVRHMAEVERIWLQRVLRSDHETRPLWLTRDEPDADLHPLDHADLIREMVDGSVGD